VHVLIGVDQCLASFEALITAHEASIQMYKAYMYVVAIFRMCTCV
jgi:hypothetical protein